VLKFDGLLGRARVEIYMTDSDIILVQTKAARHEVASAAAVGTTTVATCGRRIKRRMPRNALIRVLL
jgi:hypothetical protein